jgi:outer membrane protein
MKKIVLSLFLIFVITLSVKAQKDTLTDFKKWQVRFRVITIVPNESATIEVIGGDVDIATAIVPELDFTYFFNKNWSIELILSTSQHDVKAISTKTEAGDIELGNVWLLPPTLTLQYHFTKNKLQPYLGAGLNYTIFYNVDKGPIADAISYDNSLGFAFQTGLDVALNEKWLFNIDVKYILASTDVTINASSALGAKVGADVTINPLIIGFGFGMKF